MGEKFSGQKLEFQNAKERALKILAHRDHSALELHDKLKQKIQINDQLWDKLHASLKKSGYMGNDEDLSRRWVQRWREEGRGRHWIKAKLENKGLGSTALKDDETEMRAAQIFLEKKSRGVDFSSKNLRDQNKIKRAFAARGFSEFVTSTVLETENKIK